MKAETIPVTHVTTRGNLIAHKHSRHEGNKYPSNSFEYQATERVNLAKHKQSKHEGKKYVTITQLQGDTKLLINSPNMKTRNIPVTHVTNRQLKEDIP
jgi:hypothetical protein